MARHAADTVDDITSGVGAGKRRDPRSTAITEERAADAGPEFHAEDAPAGSCDTRQV
jgi:hypothetical protein